MSLFCSFSFDSYPIPTHSKHRRIALLNTVSTSPRYAPIHTKTADTANSAVWARRFLRSLSEKFILSASFLYFSGGPSYAQFVGIAFGLRSVVSVQRIADDLPER